MEDLLKKGIEKINYILNAPLELGALSIQALCNLDTTIHISVVGGVLGFCTVCLSGAK